MTAAPAPIVAFGLTLFELLTLFGVLLTIAATVAGSVVAVLISIAVERKRRQQEGRLQLFRALLTTRDLPSDAAWTVAFNAIPVEFNGETRVVDKWRSLLENLNFRPSVDNQARHFAERQRLKAAMLYEMAKLLRIDLSEGEIAAEAYAAQGFIERDNLYLGSLAALCDLASTARQQLGLLEQQLARAAEAQSGNPLQSGRADTLD